MPASLLMLLIIAASRHAAPQFGVVKGSTIVPPDRVPPSNLSMHQYPSLTNEIAISDPSQLSLLCTAAAMSANV
ncbi:hypothetical protein LX32DRAFT_680904, partial [Colletotrichum zoysiae]